MTRRREYFRITKFTRRYDREAGKFTFNIAYETATVLTPRTVGVAEAFGLGVDQTQKFILYDNVELKINPTDIVYITGDSGSGKSVLLKALRQDLGEEAIDMSELSIDQDKPLIDTVGKTFNEALELLSRVGLNDAFLFVRCYRELSDGQKYRYRLAKLVESGRQWCIIDEFCSVLDRDMAKIVAFNLQKLARQNGNAVMAATSHADLFEDLKPSVHVHKRFGKEITINYYPNEPVKECSLVREMQICRGTTEDWRKLSVFHYRSHKIGAVRNIFCLKHGEESCGVIVYCYPPPACFGRSRILPKMSMQNLNEKLSIISRVVVHPKYRTIGLGAKLVKETLPLAGTEYVETIAVMAKYNPFFERAGMQKVVESKPSVNLLRALGRLKELGFNVLMLDSVKENVQMIGRVDRGKIVSVFEELSKREGLLRKRLLALSSVFPSHGEFMEKLNCASVEDLAVVLKRLAFLAQTKVYLFWRKNDFKRK